MKFYKVEIYFYRNRGSWSEIYIVPALSPDDAKSKLLERAKEGGGNIMDIIQEIDLTQPYLIQDTSD